MRRPSWLALLSLVFLLALAPARGQEDDSPPEGDDANPFNLSTDEIAALKKFNELENFAIKSLQERDFDGAERRYTKLIAKLDKDELVNVVAKRRMQSYAHYNLACNYSLNGQKTEAIEELEKSLEYGFWGWKHMKKDTDLDNIRDEDGYKDAIRKWKKIEARSFVDEEERLIAQVTSSLAGKPVVKGYDWSVTTKDGNELERSELKGKVVVLSVLQPYDSEGATPDVAALVKLHHEYKKKGVVVIGLAPVAGGNLGNYLDKFIDENEIKFNVAGVRPADPVLKPYNESFGQTRFVLLDKRGKVRGTAERLKNYEALEQAVKLLLDAPDKKPAPRAKPEEKSEGQK